MFIVDSCHPERSEVSAFPQLPKKMQIPRPPRPGWKTSSLGMTPFSLTLPVGVPPTPTPFGRVVQSVDKKGDADL